MFGRVRRFNKIKTLPIKTSHPIHIRRLKPGMDKHIYISCCYYSGLQECLENIYHSNPDAFIICIGYTDGDFQIALTGTGKLNESILNTAKRETFEEIDMESDNFELFRSCTNEGSKVKTSYVYKVNANTCSTSTKQRDDFSNNDYGDERKNKITVVVYGTLEETSRIVQSSRIDPQNREHIGFYTLLRVSDAITICRKIISDNKINHEVPYKYDTYLQ